MMDFFINSISLSNLVFCNCLVVFLLTLPNFFNVRKKKKEFDSYIYYVNGIVHFVSFFSILYTLFLGIVGPHVLKTTQLIFFNFDYFGLGNITYELDGISFMFVLLTVIITYCIIVVNVDKYQKGNQLRSFYRNLFLLQITLILAFTCKNFIGFFIWFEAALIPMFLIILTKGSSLRRSTAAYQFFLYTYLGSILMLLALIKLSTLKSITNMNWNSLYALGNNLTLELGGSYFELFCVLGIVVALLVKVPSWPGHLWLTEAHVEAPTGASMMLAAVLLKLGGYGLLRFVIPVFTETIKVYSIYFILFGLLSIIVASFSTIVQTDAKKVVAYSSVVHMGYITIGLFSLTKLGLDGSILVMISHGTTSAGLFLLVGILYERLGTREVMDLRGVMRIMPKLGLAFIFFIMANISLPLTAGFIAEFITLNGVFEEHPLTTIIACIGVVLVAIYSLLLCARILFGTPSNVILEKTKIGVISDLSKRELAVLIWLGSLTCYLGVAPYLCTTFFTKEVSYIITVLNF